jgi:DNA-binding CsgD family transcriptional regulator
MSKPAVHVAIAPWSSLEADCLRHLLRSLKVVATRQVDEATDAYLLTVPRRLSPWPVQLPAEVEDLRIPVILVVDAIVPWSIALGRSVGAAGLVSWAGPDHTILAAVEAAVSSVRAVWGNGHRSRDPMTRLTERERQVMALVSQGQHDDVIAERLGISVNTVRSHVRHCLTKLDVTHRNAAATVVRRRRLVLLGADQTAAPSVRVEPG